MKLLEKCKKKTGRLCVLSICLGVVLFMPSYVIFAKDDDIVIGTIADGRKLYRAYKQEKPEISSFGVGTARSKITWQGIYSTPIIKLEDVGFVYCIEPKKAVPNGNTYSAGIHVSDEGVRALLEAGFPHNTGELTPEEAYVRTFVALNTYLGTFNRHKVESFADAYVNHLLQKADAPTKQQSELRIVEPESVETIYDEETKRSETEFYQVEGGSGDFWFEDLPEHVYAVNEDGVRTDRFTTSSKFRLVSERSDLDEALIFKVKRDVKTMHAMRYEASGVQNLVALEPKQDVNLATARVILKPSKLPEVGVKKTADKKDNKTEIKKKEPVAKQQRSGEKQPTLVKTGSTSWHIVIGFGLCLGAIVLFFYRWMYHLNLIKFVRMMARIK